MEVPLNQQIVVETKQTNSSEQILLVSQVPEPYYDVQAHYYDAIAYQAQIDEPITSSCMVMFQTADSPTSNTYGSLRANQQTISFTIPINEIHVSSSGLITI